MLWCQDRACIRACVLPSASLLASLFRVCACACVCVCVRVRVRVRVCACVCAGLMACCLRVSLLYTCSATGRLFFRAHGPAAVLHARTHAGGSGGAVRIGASDSSTGSLYRQQQIHKVNVCHVRTRARARVSACVRGIAFEHTPHSCQLASIRHHPLVQCHACAVCTGLRPSRARHTRARVLQHHGVPPSSSACSHSRVTQTRECMCLCF